MFSFVGCFRRTHGSRRAAVPTKGRALSAPSQYSTQLATQYSVLSTQLLNDQRSTFNSFNGDAETVRIINIS